MQRNSAIYLVVVGIIGLCLWLLLQHGQHLEIGSYTPILKPVAKNLTGKFCQIQRLLAEGFSTNAQYRVYRIPYTPKKEDVTPSGREGFLYTTLFLLSILNSTQLQFRYQCSSRRQGNQLESHDSLQNRDSLIAVSSDLESGAQKCLRMKSDSKYLLNDVSSDIVGRD